ncbi:MULTISPECIES: FAD-dependent oxidoreductase [Sphingobacterium]|uniref:Flavin-dependent monooxygenase n=1 Tax=Sphingobacterium multivorum TaxID=28454 RepID=A0ABX7CVT1_SPHMU|nr:NAD(P)/FAD-dependent oxidoreductase [Sphingobacterium multivorum]QQT32772.1 FAD-dependent monooxygenase [Sphingobacterium multivorum]QQT56205.1 FAD-dependent monooxygenase [Sphingobacterium multivorum]
MKLQDKKVAIVGGGPGGLTLAKLLQLKGVNVTVYERDSNKEVRQQGATLDLHEESGLEALRRANLMNEFKASFRPDAGRLRVLDEQAIIKMDEHELQDKDQEDRPEIDRAPLRDILINALHEDTIVWDSQFISMVKQDHGWLLHFKNGKSFYADLVIAADGANSKIRPYLTDIKPIYSGVTIVEGNIYEAEKNTPKLWEITKGGKVFALGNGQSIILSAKGEGSLSFYTGCKVPENWAQESGIDFNNKQQVFDWFKVAFSYWSEKWHELFASNEIWFMPRPQYHFPLDQTWTTLSNLTMLGDAAHRMPPYAGEGVNQAMQDAFELAENLTCDHFPDIQTAISNYERQMQARAAAVTKDTLQNTEILHAEDGLDNLLAMFTERR